MAQNVIINKNKTVGDTIAADSISGVKHQKIKMEFGETGSATLVSNSNPMPVKLATNISNDDASIDAFGRLRVSEPLSLFDSKQIYDGQPLAWAQKIIGNATITYSTNKAASILNCTTTSGDKAIKQSRMYIPYQPGKSFSIKLTGVLGSSKTNVIQRIGYFDDNNGLFFEQTSTALKVVTRSKSTGTVINDSVNQSAWNIDKMDGTGNSGITLDLSKVQIFVIDFQWLGVGRVRFGFNINGKNYYVHQFVHANLDMYVYMSTPTLPVRFELENTGTVASTTSLDAICASVVSEGGYVFNGIRRSADRGMTFISVDTSIRPIISLKLSSNYIRSTLSNFSYDIYNAGNGFFRYGIYLNPIITGGSSASWTPVSNSYAEFDMTRNGIVSGGTLLQSGYSIGSLKQAILGEIDSNLVLAADVDGVSDQLVIAAQVSSGSDNFYGAISWKEYN